MQDSKTQIAMGVLGLIGALGTALFSNWDKIFPQSFQPVPPSPLSSPALPSVQPSVAVSASLSPDIASSTPSTATPKPLIRTENTTPSIVPSPAPPLSFNSAIQPKWKFFGKASTGEGIFVRLDSVEKNGSSIDFKYRIGSEILDASAECGSSQWYVGKYDKWYSPSSQSTQDMLDFVCR
jgi:hypothetical protein